MKPEKEPFMRFYFVRPVKAINGFWGIFGRDFLTLVFNWWMCGSCGKLYSPRVRKYDEGDGDHWCSICHERFEEFMKNERKKPSRGLRFPKLPSIFGD